MADLNRDPAQHLADLLPDLDGGRMVIIGAGGVGEAVARLALGIGLRVTLANRSQPKLDKLRELLPDAAFRVVNARNEESVKTLLDEALPDHIVLTTGRVMGLASGHIDPLQAMDYFGDRFEPIMAIANWIALSDRRPRSFTIVSGFIGLPTMGNLAWSMAGPAIRGAVEHLAVELGPTRVNAVAPGPLVDTKMARDVVGGDEGVRGMSETLARQLPIGRAVCAEDAARQVLLVAGDPIATGSVRFTEGGLALVPGSLLRDLHIEDHGR